MRDDLVDELKLADRERWLATLWAAAGERPALAAVFAFDLELERVVADAKEPLLAELRLAWWREQLAAIAGGAPPPAQPLLRALARDARRHGVDLVALSGIEDALLPLLGEGAVDLVEIALARGARLGGAICAVGGHPPSTASEAAAARVCFARFARRAWGQAASRVEAGLEAWRATAVGTFLSSEGQLPRVLAGLDTVARQDLARLRKGQPLAPVAGLRRQVAIGRAALGLSFAALG